MDLSLLHQDLSCQPQQTHHTRQQTLRLSRVIFSIICVLFNIPSLFHPIQLDQTQALLSFSHVYFCYLLHLTASAWNCCTKSSHIKWIAYMYQLLLCSWPYCYTNYELIHLVYSYQSIKLTHVSIIINWTTCTWPTLPHHIVAHAILLYIVM